VAVTLNGVQPWVELSANCGIKGASTQIVLLMESISQRFPIFNVMVYEPGFVKTGQMALEPELHWAGSVLPKSLPKLPLLRVKPVEGVIRHTKVAVLEHIFPFIVLALLDVFVKQI
jgi:hypothetical protein